jgi:hypothetical protein
VDVFLEALEVAERGDVLVVENAGRTDEACVGDLVTREVGNAGLGRSFRDQAAFWQYLARGAQDPAFGFREHLKLIGGAIEE